MNMPQFQVTKVELLIGSTRVEIESSVGWLLTVKLWLTAGSYKTLLVDVEYTIDRAQAARDIISLSRSGNVTGSELDRMMDVLLAVASFPW